jgi:hypothetical protein
LAEARSRFSPRRGLVPILGLLDRSRKAAHQRPDPADDGTRFPEFPWDLRTLILLFPPEAPFRFMNLNLLLGSTGTLFDRPERMGALDAGDAFDLQFCLEGRERCATYKRYHSIARELSHRPAAVEFLLGERLRFEGSWPTYRIRYRQPEAGLSLTLHLDCWEDLQWWAHAPRLYCHYTSFGSCRMEWQWESESGAVEVPALHDHGWGRNLLPLRVPLRTFDYEVLQLRAATEDMEGSEVSQQQAATEDMEGSEVSQQQATPEDTEGLAISLATEGPFGIELKKSGVLRWGRRHRQVMDRYERRVLEWESFENHAGTPCRVPRRWLGRLSGSGTRFEYEAQRGTEPRAVLGDGFLFGFDYRGVLGPERAVEDRNAMLERPLERTVEGTGYAEQMGSLPRRVRSELREPAT